MVIFSAIPKFKTFAVACMILIFHGYCLKLFGISVVMCLVFKILYNNNNTMNDYDVVELF